MMRSNTVPFATAILLFTALGAVASPRGAACAESAWYALPQPPDVAFRRLEAENAKSGKHAWMDVRTTLAVTASWWSKSSRKAAPSRSETVYFRAALERERTLLAKRFSGNASAATGTYECSEAEPDASGLLRVALKAGPKGGDNLVIGNMFLQPSTGDVVRVAGRLAKSPSFWVSQVDVDWSYARVHNDIVLPVCLQSAARVKIFGLSTFRMTYEYVSVDGQPVTSSALASRH